MLPRSSSSSSSLDARMNTTTNDTSGTTPDVTSQYDEQDPLWRQFNAATSPEVFCNAWLALHCRSIQGVAGGVVLLGSPEENRPFAPVAFWPDKRQNLRYLAQVAERALNERRGIMARRQHENGSSHT